MSGNGFFGRFLHRLDFSAVFTIGGIILLFSSAVVVTLVAPRFVDPSWTQPTSRYQQQMYEVIDPNLYISSTMTGGKELQHVYHLKEDFILLAFIETNLTRIVASPDLEKYITRFGDTTLKLTSRLLLLREPQEPNEEEEFNGLEAAKSLNEKLQQEWIEQNPDWKEKGLQKFNYNILELYVPGSLEAFAFVQTQGILENWAEEDYEILDEAIRQPFHRDRGVIYINNPQEYRISRFRAGGLEGWRFDPSGERVTTLERLRGKELGFRSRKELIELGEHIFAIEGCWYCHSDQTRTLVQDVVLNGSESYPAPPSSPNEYIYQKVTFPATRRIGPDLSRVGIKKPHRDWHISHFWSPKSESPGTIMPAFRHFFDEDPSGTRREEVGIPNYKFEAVFQYLMTKGTRITSPNEAWWLGKDPVQTLEIIEGKKKFE